MDNSKEKFDEDFTKYYERLTRAATKWQHYIEAGDLVHNAYVYALEGLESYDGNFLPYMLNAINLQGMAASKDMSLNKEFPFSEVYPEDEDMDSYFGEAVADRGGWMVQDEGHRHVSDDGKVWIMENGQYGDLADELHANEVLDQVRNVLDRIDPKYHDLIQDYCEGWAVPELVDKHGLPRATVFRQIAKFKTIVNEELDYDVD